MRLARTILALAIAISLAWLPVGASAAGGAIVQDHAQSSMQMSAPDDMSMDDCCPDNMKTAPSHTNGHKCSMGFCCIGPSASLAQIDVAHFGLLSSNGSMLPIPVDQVVSSNGGSPPYRPPRV